MAHLHGEIARPEVPRALLRARLALGAAQAVLRLEGRREVLAALRDAVHLLGPGDQPDPLGAAWLLWRQAAARPLAAIGVVLPEVPERWIAAALGLGLGLGQGGLTHRFAGVLQQILDEDPRAETPALILAEASASRALGWDHLTPLIVAGLRPGDLRLRGADLRRACEAALLRQAPEVMQLTIEVTRGAGRLRAVAPKLRAKGAGQAVALFLSRDALAPRDLAALMSDRAARRLCERLVELGAVRELTGRDSFRLYGV
ncbi:hypothetical protein U879_03440 [Defluviimonas sp. 20V17]|uniref:DUF1403 family protein n=1 Tax=Allgaiera indica TaxID=765699 RepID=A0AAN4UTK5_9RHOB|nr:hypothetical protein U879_03440 [Defluviimonas sp. 20V17]GHE04502.1 hypothetical protein GCM10008024_31890 [Allgaiera indica]